jgi:hypothetical protein
MKAWEHEQYYGASGLARIRELEQQLAAERERGYQRMLDEREKVTALEDQLAAEREKRKQLEADYQKIVTEVLKCDPIPASQRSDDQLEPPWEVIARIRQQLAAEREGQQQEKQNLVRKYSDIIAAEREKRENAETWAKALCQEQLECEQQLAATERERYQELLYAVERKWPNETRHQTALRYIQEAERHDDATDSPTGQAL